MNPLTPLFRYQFAVRWMRLIIVAAAHARALARMEAKQRKQIAPFTEAA